MTCSSSPATAQEQELAAEARRDSQFDVSVMPLRQLRSDAMPGSGTEFFRYAYVHSKVLHDTTDGQIARWLDAKRTLSPSEVDDLAPNALDAFLNSTYRSLKDERDGYPTAAPSMPPTRYRAISRTSSRCIDASGRTTNTWCGNWTVALSTGRSGRKTTCCPCWSG